MNMVELSSDEKSCVSGGFSFIEFGAETGAMLLSFVAVPFVFFIFGKNNRLVLKKYERFASYSKIQQFKAVMGVIGGGKVAICSAVTGLGSIISYWAGNKIDEKEE